MKEETLSSDHLVDGVLLQVYRDTVRLEDGAISVREWIDHPGASAVVPLFDDGSTILIQQFRYGPQKVFWEVPAGKADHAGDGPEDVARRELEEETGWIPGSLVHLGGYYPCIGYSNEIIHLYLAEGLSKGVRELAPGERLECIRMPFDEAVEMVQSGDVVDMKSVVAIIRAQAVLESRRGGVGSREASGP